MSKYIRADGKNNLRFDFRGYPRGLAQRLLKFNRMSVSLHRTDWIYGISSDQYLTESERLLGINIINHLHLENQQCHPDQEMLAARLGCTRRSVVRRVKEVRTAGWLTVGRQRDGDHQRGRPANEYLPTIPAALVEAIRVAFPEENKVISRSHLNGAELSDTRSELSDTKRPNKVTPICHAFREGIDNKKEKRFSDEERDFGVEKCFVEVDTPEWKAWSKFRRWPQNDFRINGIVRRGWWFRSEWPTSEIKSKANWLAAPVQSGVLR